MTLAGALLSRRDPEERAINFDNAYWASWRAGEEPGLTSMTPAGVNVNRASALGLSAFWACVSLISDSIATLPADTIREDDDGIASPFRPRPVWLDVPNPEQTKVDFVFNQIASLLIHGTTFVYTVRDQRRATFGDVLEAWVIDPEMVQVRREFRPDGSLELVYYVMVARGQQSPVGPFRVPAGPEMFHIVGPQIHAGYPLGLPPLEVARMMYGGAIAAQEMSGRFFGQGMNAAGVIEVEDELTMDQAKQLKQDFKNRNAGLKNMHLPPVLSGGATWKAMSISPEQAQFIQSREFTVDEIARWFRVPPHMIGHLVRSTSWGTGLEFQGMTFVNYTLRPWIERLEAAWSRWMLTFSPGAQVRFDVTGLLRGDLAARAAWYGAGRQWGWLNADEIRAMEGEQPLPDGKGQIYLQPVNMAEAGAALPLSGFTPTSGYVAGPDAGNPVPGPADSPSVDIVGP